VFSGHVERRNNVRGSVLKAVTVKYGAMKHLLRAKAHQSLAIRPRDAGAINMLFPGPNAVKTDATSRNGSTEVKGM